MPASSCGEPALVLALLAICVMALSGLYHNKAFADFRVMAIQIAIAFVALLGIVSVYDCTFRKPSIILPDPPGAFAKTAVLTWLVCILVTRFAFSRLANLDFLKRRVVVLGTGEKAARIASLAAAGADRYFVPVAYLDCGWRKQHHRNGAGRSFATRDPMPSLDCARGLAAREIVVAADDCDPLPVTELLRCRAAGIRVSNYMDFIERQTKTVDPDALQPSWLIFSDGFRESALAKLSKRCFDIVFALALLLFTLPLMAADGAGDRARQQGAGLLQAGTRGLQRAAVPGYQVPQHAHRCRKGWRAAMGRAARCARHPSGGADPQASHRRAAAAVECAARRDEPGRTAAGTSGFCRRVYQANSVLRGTPLRQARDYRMGAGQLSLRRFTRDARNKLAYDLYYVKNRGCFST